MNKLLLFGLPAIALPMALWARPRTPFVPQSELANLVPGNALLYVEGPGLPQLLASGLEHPLLATVMASDFAKVLLAASPLSPEAALAQADEYLGRPLLPTLATLASQGSAFALGLKRGKPTYTVALRGSDASLLRSTLDSLLVQLAQQLALPPEKLSAPHDQIRGVDIWYLGEELAIGVAGELFLASNDEGRLRDMIDLGASQGSSGKSMAQDESFCSARAARSEAATLWTWINLAAIEEETAGGGAKLRAMASNPGVQFLLGPAVAALGSAEQLALDLILAGERVELSVAGRGLPSGPAERVLYTLDAATPKLSLPLGVDGGVALLYRDLAGLFRERTELFPAEVLPKFSEAIANLAFLFGGGDITDDVLPALSPWLALVVRDPLFRGGAVPEIKLPGAALIAQINDVEQLGDRLVAGFQSLIGFINIDGAQNARQPMLLDIELHEGIKVSSAHFPLPAAGEGVNLHYNLEPACAVVGNHFVVATHVSLVRSLVGQIQRGEIEGSLARGETLALAGATVARVLHQNSEALVMNAVLNEGKEMAVARHEIAALENLAKLIRTLEFTTHRPSADRLQLALALELEHKEVR